MNNVHWTYNITHQLLNHPLSLGSQFTDSSKHVAPTDKDMFGEGSPGTSDVRELVIQYIGWTIWLPQKSDNNSKTTTGGKITCSLFLSAEQEQKVPHRYCFDWSHTWKWRNQIFSQRRVYWKCGKRPIPLNIVLQIESYVAEYFQYGMFQTELE